MRNADEPSHRSQKANDGSGVFFRCYGLRTPSDKENTGSEGSDWETKDKDEWFHDGERVTEKAENVNIFFVLFFFFIFAKVYFFLDKSLTESAFLIC